MVFIVLDWSTHYAEFSHNAFWRLKAKKLGTFQFIVDLFGFLQILESDLLQVAKVMGLEDEIDVTDDIGVADAILASSSEMKQNPWIRGVAKFHQLPLFVIKVTRIPFFYLLTKKQVVAPTHI